MARPIKKGIDYFPLDVDFLKDMKIRKIMRACGGTAPTILICLLGNIYKDEGYYMRWDEDTCFLVADDVGTSEATVSEVVKKAIQVKFFDQRLFDDFHILTSRGIQKRYAKAAYKKTDNSINSDYNLVSGSENPVSGGESTQRKLKKSKVNKTRENNKPTAVVSKNLAFDLWENLWGFPNAIAREELVGWIGEFGDDLIAFAIRYAAVRNVKARAAVNYLGKVVDGYREHGIKTVEQAQAESEKHQQMSKSNMPNNFGNQSKQQRSSEPIPSWFKNYKGVQHG